MQLKPQDRPDIISRVFKIKFDQFLNDLKKHHILGQVVGYIYTIEFQKRGLPHAHILLFLHPSSKYPSPEDIDNIITAAIPNTMEEPELYELVKSHMVHGPCGSANSKSPCMNNGKCTKYYPKKFQSNTIVDEDGYPIYRRRDNGQNIDKNYVTLDNRHIVPYNRKLLLKHQAHINMEWCNQRSSIKYLFKYINKGYDRVTATIISTENDTPSQMQIIDEIKQYLDCRYMSPCEACWRIFSFPIHGRSPAVERLYFHLENEQFVIFDDYEVIDDILSKPTVKYSMFTSWMEANKNYVGARDLTYAEFVSKFVYISGNRCWKPRKQRNTIGRLIWVPPSTGELFYLRMMLTSIKGPCNYEHIRNVNNVIYPTFREACFPISFLEDDREYIEAIKEANEWGSGYYLRKLFVTMLTSNSINRPKHVWQQTWKLLADGILYEQRRLSNMQKIENLLQRNRKSLRDYPSMPYPEGRITSQLGNRLIYVERDYDKEELKAEFRHCFNLLTDEQRIILIRS